MIKTFFNDDSCFLIAGTFIWLVVGMIIGSSIAERIYKKGMDEFKDQAVSLNYGSYVVHTNQSDERVVSFQWNTNK